MSFCTMVEDELYADAAQLSLYYYVMSITLVVFLCTAINNIANSEFVMLITHCSSYSL